MLENRGINKVDWSKKDPYYEKMYKRFFRSFYIGRRRRNYLTEQADYMYRYIRSMRYIQDENDCSNKNGEFVRRMRDLGHDAKIMVVATSRGAHAITWIRGKGFYDATSTLSMAFCKYENENFQFRNDVISGLMYGYEYRYATQPDHFMWSEQEFDMAPERIKMISDAMKKEFGNNYER